MFCCMSMSKIAPQEISEIMDKQRAEKYGISIGRYRKILELPNMTRDLVHFIHMNGWDFTDTSKDLQLFAEMQSFDKKNLPDNMDIMDITEKDY